MLSIGAEAETLLATGTEREQDQFEERARRRHQQGLHDQVAKRDTLDSQRLSESLRGATVIDSTLLTLEQVVEQMSAAIAAKFDSANPSAQ